MHKGWDQCRADYVLIIEWLPPSDVMQTGTMLHQYLTAKHSSIPVELVRCNGRSDVLAAIDVATKEVPTKGVPIVQLEAHGYGLGRFSQGGIACHGRFRWQTSRLGWHQLWPRFRALNEASGYQLLVVAAACKGDTALFGVETSFRHANWRTGNGILPSPFSAAVGFEGNVGTVALFAAMKVFYDGVFSGMQIDQAVANANAQLGPGEHLDWLSAASIAKDMMKIRMGFRFLRLRFFWFRLRNRTSQESEDDFKARLTLEMTIRTHYALTHFMGRNRY